MKVVRRLLVVGLLLLTTSLSAQKSDPIQQQKQIIADLERQIAAEEASIAKLQSGRAAAEERVRRMAKQINQRNRLLEASEREADLLRVEVRRKDSLAGRLDQRLSLLRQNYADMVREAYRNYQHNNYITYIFASRNFSDIARRLTALREVALIRARRMEEIRTLSAEVQQEQAALARRQRSLDSVKRQLTQQKRTLERDTRNARNAAQKLSKQEQAALQRKVEQEEQLSVAISELRKLTKGNTAGDSFNAKTSGLNLPVAQGRVKRYKGNMAEISGPRGARVNTIYEGKVVEVKQNHITGKMEVFIAHGDYITSYANMATATVKKGQQVAKNQQIGTIGSSVNVLTMETEYKLVFGIFPPDNRKMTAEQCFKKR